MLVRLTLSRVYGSRTNWELGRTLVKCSPLPTLPGKTAQISELAGGFLYLVKVRNISNLSRVADKYGRKTSFYVAWVWLVVVSTGSHCSTLGNIPERLPDATLGLCAPEHSKDTGRLGKSTPIHDANVSIY